MTQIPQVYSPELAELVTEVRALRQDVADLRALVVLVFQAEGAIMTDLSRIQAEVTENGDVVDSAVALLGNLAQQVRDLSTDPVALEALADELDANSASLAAAVVANTPTAPPTEPPTEPPVEPPVEPPA